MNLSENEQIEELMVNGLRLIQNRNLYRFTSDAVLLADFAVIKKGDVLADFCSGSGVIPILICGKTDKVKRVFCVEIQNEMCELIEKNIELNALTTKFEILKGCVSDSANDLRMRGVNVITVNPPYRKVGSGAANKTDALAIAKSEVKLSLAKLIDSAASVLGTGGRFYIVHMAERLSELFYRMEKCSITPKKLRLVQSKPSQRPHLALVEGIKHAGSGLTIMHNLVMEDEDGRRSPQLEEIYAKTQK